MHLDLAGEGGRRNFQVFIEATGTLWERRLAVILGEAWSVSKAGAKHTAASRAVQSLQRRGMNRMKQAQEIIQTEEKKTQGSETGEKHFHQ